MTLKQTMKNQHIDLDKLFKDRNVVTVKEVALVTRLSYSAVTKRCRELQLGKIGQHRRLTRSDVERLVADWKEERA